MPLWIVPDQKLSVQDVENCMRDHYEGTPMAIDSTDMGGGIWQMPYRPTPLEFTVNGKKYFNERPTSTQQTGFSYVAQLRSWLPREIGGILWFGNATAIWWLTCLFIVVRRSSPSVSTHPEPMLHTSL